MAVEIIQGVSQVGSGGTPGHRGVKQKPAGGGPGTFGAAGNRTPEEALTYIKRLYKAGRTGELAELLRHSPVLREAWQTLQQVSTAESQVSLGSDFSLPDSSSGRSGLPALSSGKKAQTQLSSPGREPALPQVTTGQGAYSDSSPYPVPFPKPSGLLAAARQVYEAQARYYSQERADFPRISIRI
jgi:hypothetical protein